MCHFFLLQISFHWEVSFEFESYCMPLYSAYTGSGIDLSFPLSDLSLPLSLSPKDFWLFFLVAYPEKATSNALSRLQHLNVTKGDTDECPPLLWRSSPLLHFSPSFFPLAPFSPHTHVPSRASLPPSLPHSHFSLSLSEDNRARWTEMALWVTQVGTSFSVCIRGRWDEWCSLCESPALLWHAIPPASISINPGRWSSNLNKCSCFSPCGAYCTLASSIIWLGMMRF